jgi:hypothetical protein
VPSWRLLIRAEGASLACATAGKTIQEVALFDAAGSGLPVTGGNMLCRAVHGAQALNVGDASECHGRAALPLATGFGRMHIRRHGGDVRA